MLRLDDAINKAVNTLCGRQGDDGSWDPGCEFDPSATALYILILRYLRRANAVEEAEFVRYLRHEQLRDGGWAGSPDSAADLDISVLCYTALRVAGVPSENEALVRAREVIETQGGITGIGFVPRVMLRMLGQIPATALPYFSPRFIDLPQRIRLPFLRELSFLDLGLAPLSLLRDEQVRPLDQDRSIRELDLKAVRWRIRPSRKQSDPGMPPLQRLITSIFWRGLGAVSMTFRLFDSLFPPVRSRRKVSQWILDHQGSDGTFAEYLTPTVLNLMALETLDRSASSAIISKGLRSMETWIGRDTRGAWMPLTPSTTFHTATLLEGFKRLPSVEFSALTAARWLFLHQASTSGLWGDHSPAGTPAGAWCFGRENSWLVDADDTAIALSGLRRFRHDYPDHYQRGISWLLAMQDTGGGWAGFTPRLKLLGRLPGGFLDPAIAATVSPDEDITARALIALHPLCNATDDSSGAIHSAVQRAVTFLWNRRRPDGTWFGRWAVNYTYGTAQVIEALLQCGCGGDSRTRESMLWLMSVQNPDGGWGESKLGYSTARYEPGPSSPLITAFVLRALITDGTDSDAASGRAVQYLLASQRSDGLWADTGWNGVAIPRMTYLRYDPSGFVLSALTMARDHFNHYRSRPSSA